MILSSFFTALFSSLKPLVRPHSFTLLLLPTFKHKTIFGFFLKLGLLSSSFGLFRPRFFLTLPIALGFRLHSSSFRRTFGDSSQSNPKLDINSTISRAADTAVRLIFWLCRATFFLSTSTDFYLVHFQAQADSLSEAGSPH